MSKLLEGRWNRPDAQVQKHTLVRKVILHAHHPSSEILDPRPDSSVVC
jgi:hypothetical protein